MTVRAMKSAGVLCAAALALAGLPAKSAAADYDVGVLKCRFNGSDAAIHFGAKRQLSCTFIHRNGTRKERYLGIVEKYGVEVGFIDKHLLRWKVTSRRHKKLRRGALTGTYRGATAEASIGTGFAANLLTGGPNRSVELQPVAFQSLDGLNVAVGYLVLTLKRYR